MSVYDDVRAERERQDSQWGGAAHDDEHDPSVWPTLIEKFADRAALRRREMDPYAMRDALVKVAALAVAGIESLDRTTLSDA